jgi:hypothetical protein
LGLPGRQVVLFALLAIAVLGGVLAVVLHLNRGAHVEIQGTIQKVRIQGLDDKSAIVVVDFRFANPSNYPFVVRSVTVLIEDSQGNALEGTAVAEVDAGRIFQYYPLLGGKFNESLKMRDKVPQKESLDRMVAARFEVGAPQLEARRKLTVRVEEVDGNVSEIAEARPAGPR